MYAELTYFEGYHFSHIAAWHEEQRLRAIVARDLRFLMSHQRNNRLHQM